MKLVYDRTWEDVRIGTEKGTYGVADLNRVEQAVAELYRLADGLDVGEAPQSKTDWALPSRFSAETWPTKDQMARYLANVHRLCDALELAAKLPQTMERLTWESANDMERALDLAYIRIQSILQAFRFSGEFFAGEESRL